MATVKKIKDTAGTAHDIGAKYDYNGDQIDATYLKKLTYEFNKQLALGGSGKVCIGKFPMYDSNITVNIDSTTSTTYHGTLVIATQNINTSAGGSYTATVYGDASNSLTPNIKIKYVSGSNVFSVYIDLPGWSKNVLHIKCVALAGTPTNIAELVDSIPTDAKIVPTNALTTNFKDTKVTSAANHYAPTADSTKELTASLSGTAGAYAKDTEYTVLTGVKAQRDAAGHVTGLTYTAQKIKDTNTTYNTATSSAAGLMSAADKTKLDGIATGANNYTHPTTAGNKHIPSGGSSGQLLGWSASGTAEWKNASSHGNHVPAAETANNAKFLRNDNTWATVTPANIGAAASSHNHDGVYAKLAGSNTFSGTNIFNSGITFVQGGSITEDNNCNIILNCDGGHITAGSNANGFKGNLDGTATKANALTSTSKGSATQPVYFDANGKPVACTYSLGKTVPSDAKFTDTVYTHPSTAGNKHIPSGGATGQFLKYRSSGTAVWSTLTTTDIGAVSQSLFDDYTSYAESSYAQIGGSNATGTWPISITGSAASATTATNANNVKVTVTTSSAYYPIVLGPSTTSGGTISSGNKALYMDSANSCYYNPNSNQLTCSGGFFETSDERLKDIVKPISVDLDQLSKLRKVYFNWKDKPESAQQLGMIAQDVQEIYPELVSEAEDGKLSLSYEKLSVVALEAIDVLHKENNELKSRIERLESLVNQLAEKVND